METAKVDWEGWKEAGNTEEPSVRGCTGLSGCPSTHVVPSYAQSGPPLGSNVLWAVDGGHPQRT
jgi:hypothetical protein